MEFAEIAPPSPEAALPTKSVVGAVTSGCALEIVTMLALIAPPRFDWLSLKVESWMVTLPFLVRIAPPSPLEVFSSTRTRVSSSERVTQYSS